MQLQMAMVDGKIEEVPAGGCHFRPRKIEHTSWDATDKPLRFVDMYFNQNFEDYVEELFLKIFPQMIKEGKTPDNPPLQKD